LGPLLLVYVFLDDDMGVIGSVPDMVDNLQSARLPRRLATSNKCPLALDRRDVIKRGHGKRQEESVLLNGGDDEE